MSNFKYGTIGTRAISEIYGTHEEWYRLPSDIYQTAKISKLLLLAQGNTINQLQGRNINEIEIDDNILENEESDSEEEIDNGVTENAPSTVQITTQSKKEKTKRRLLPWTKEEKRVTENFFKTHITRKIPPKKAKVEKLIEQNTGLFSGRNWKSIKVFVQNKYRLLK